MPVIGFQAEQGDKVTSGGFKDFFGLDKLVKKIIPEEAFKDAFRLGRGLIDAIAGAAGVPLSTLRGDLAKNGVDPDAYELYLAELLAGYQSGKPGQRGDAENLSRTAALPGADDLTAYSAEAEDKSKLAIPPFIWIGGLILAALALFGRKGRR